RSSSGACSEPPLGGGSGLVHQADDPELPHRLVRAARGPARDPGNRTVLRGAGLMASARFGRVLTAMVTPFAPDGSFDPDGAADLARWLVAHGNDGLVLAGTTGEAPTLKVDEHIE